MVRLVVRVMSVICGCCLWWLGMVHKGVGVVVTGNIIVACCRASLMVLGVCLYMVRYSSCVSIAVVVLF